jgi:hypothetical protein
MTPPNRDELKHAFWGGIAFVLLGGAMLSFGEPNAGVAIAAWAALALGSVGIVGVILRLSGVWRPELRAPSARKVKKEQAAQSAMSARVNAPRHNQGEAPVLAPARKGVVRRVVKLMADEGVLAPEVPDPAMLFEAVADWGGPVTQASVLGALAEANYWHPAFDPERSMANAVMHDSHSEQFEEVLRSQIDDLVRLARGALIVGDVVIDLALLNGSGPHPPCTISMTINDRLVAMRYAPAAKYLSTHIHVVLARALKAMGCGKRLAWLWTDQGAWIACLVDGAVERLNAGPGFDRDGFDGWDWIDASEPMAAGDMVLPN